MYDKEDLLPSNRNYLFFIGCFTIIFTLIVVIVLINSSKKPEIINNIVKKNEVTSPKADLTKYNQDSDNDLIPNFVEDEAVLNTYVSEKNYCEGSNPSCRENPFITPTYITILIDSSTSMNIPARENLSKINLIKQDLQNYLIDSIKEPFVKTQIIGFGNKGNLNFIADNESCVANLKFKDFNQNLKDQESSNLVFKNLVPNGKSPISFSLEQAEKSFPEKNGNNLVIIITDGIDDCGVELVSAFKGVLDRKIVKKINVLSLFTSNDDNQKLKEATERNGGRFTTSEQIYSAITGWKKDFMLTNWCKFQNQNVINNCLNKNYNLAFETLNNQVTSQTPTNETSKIREIKSSIELFLQNYKNSKNNEILNDFNTQYESTTKQN